MKRSLCVLIAVAVGVACAADVTPPAPSAPAPTLALPAVQPPPTGRALRAMRADCVASPEISAARVPLDPATLPWDTALRRAAANPGHPWLQADVVPDDVDLAQTRLHAAPVWMLGFEAPPPFPILGRTSLRFTAWVATVDATTGEFVIAWTCGRVTP